MPTGKDVRVSSIFGDDEKLAEDRIEKFKKDAAWRKNFVDFERYLNFYEPDPTNVKYDDDGNRRLIDRDDEGFPRINLVQRTVDDSVYFVTQSLPDAELRADRSEITSEMDPLERELRLKNVSQTEDTMNAWLNSILMKNEYRDEIEKAVFDSGVFGIGYLLTHVDNNTDVRNSYKLRGLIHKLQKGQTLNRREARLYRRLSEKISVDYVDARKVFLQHGVRDHGSDNMLRQSVYDARDIETVKQRYSNVEGIDELQPGHGDYHIDYGDDYDEVDSNKVGVITTWEVEPFKDTYRMGSTRLSFLNARMIKTTIAGDMVVEKEMWESTEGAVRLPIVPFVFRRSRRHPYGRSQAKDLAQSEHLINRVRSLMFKSGLESIRPNGVSIFVKNLGPDDRQELEKSFETGEPAFITGNMVGNDTTDIREIVMPHNFASSPLDPSLRQMMQMEMQAFRTNSFQGNPEDVGQARTGRAKRAQIQFNDRPKSLSVQAITRSVENVYDNLYELMRTTYNEKHSVTINGPQGRRQVTINEQFNEKLPVFDEEGNPKTDPQGGIILNELQMTLNSTSVDMKAQAETRGTLPHDMISRFQILRQLEEAGYVVKETSRDYILDDSLKLADDINRQKKQEQQQQQARQVLQQMAAQQRQRAQQGQSPQQVQQQQQQQSPGQAAAQGVMPEDVAQDRRQDLEDEGLDNQ